MEKTQNTQTQTVKRIVAWTSIVVLVLAFGYLLLLDIGKYSPVGFGTQTYEQYMNGFDDRVNDAIFDAQMDEAAAELIDILNSQK